MTVKILHNPRCTKCRLTLEILENKKLDPEIVKYLDAPPDRNQLEDILEMLGMEPRDLMRKHEAPYKENNLSDDSLTREQLIDAMIAHPILIERPIVISNGKAAIGRPPEKVLDIL